MHCATLCSTDVSEMLAVLVGLALAVATIYPWGLNGPPSIRAARPEPVPEDVAVRRGRATAAWLGEGRELRGRVFELRTHARFVARVQHEWRDHPGARQRRSAERHLQHRVARVHHAAVAWIRSVESLPHVERLRLRELGIDLDALRPLLAFSRAPETDPGAHDEIDRILAECRAADRAIEHVDQLVCAPETPLYR